MMTAMGQLTPADDEQTDYSILLGFVAPPERIDPHVHVVTTPIPPDLRKVVEIVRNKNTAPQPVRTAAADK